ncbi:MAG: hypothetical protein ACTSW1_05840 [Candidatus Hodarchaeales archaeon]
MSNHSGYRSEVYIESLEKEFKSLVQNIEDPQVRKAVRTLHDLMEIKLNLLAWDSDRFRGLYCDDFR